MIDLKEFIYLLRKSAPAILIAAVATAVVFGIALPSVDGAPRADVLVSLSFGELSDAKDETISYDGYYVVEAQRRFGDLLGQELLRDDLKQAVQSRAGGTISRVSRVSPLDFRVTIRGIDGIEMAETTRSAIEDIFSDALIGAVERSGEPLILSVTTRSPVMLAPVWTFWKAAWVGTILGIFFAIVFLLLRAGTRSPIVTIVEEVISIEEEI